MLYIFLFWVYFFIIFYIAGICFTRLSRLILKIDIPSPHFLTTIWLGITFITLLLNYLHFFFKISEFLHTILFSGLCLYAICDRKLLIRDLLQTIKKEKYAHFVFIFTSLLFLYVGKYAIESSKNFDDGLYYVQAIKWIKSYPVIIGLGNLHGRFAFNSTWFLTGAFADVFYFENKSFHVLNSFVFLMTLVSSYISLLNFLKGNKKVSILFNALLMIPLFQASFFPEYFISSNSPDLPVALLIFQIIFCFIYFLEQDNNPRQQHLLLTISILIFFAITIKLSAILLLIIPLYMIFKNKINFKICSHLTIFFSLLVAPWLVSNVMLSGWIIYPVHHIDLFDYDWKVPKKQLMGESQWIESWAKAPGLPPEKVLAGGFIHWFKPWYEKHKNRKELVPFLHLTIIHMVMMVFFWRKMKPYLKKLWILYLVLLLCIVFWFFKAPDLRFGYGYITSFWILILSIMLIVPLEKINFHEISSSVLVTLFTLYMLAFFIQFKIPDTVSLFQKELKGHHGVRTNDYITMHRLKIKVPKVQGKCWNAELPCAPHPPADLMLRKHDLAGGFRRRSLVYSNQ